MLFDNSIISAWFAVFSPNRHRTTVFTHGPFKGPAIKWALAAFDA
jgi:hypothetical protein